MPIRHEVTEQLYIGRKVRAWPHACRSDRPGSSREDLMRMASSKAVAAVSRRGGVAVRRPAGFAQDAARGAIRRGPLFDLVQRGRAAALRPRHALPALVLVSASPRSFSRRRLRRTRSAPLPIGGSRSACSSIRTFRRQRKISRSALPRWRRDKALGAKTQRERDYIDALLAFYTDHERVPHGQRVQAT